MLGRSVGSSRSGARLFWLLRSLGSCWLARRLRTEARGVLTSNQLANHGGHCHAVGFRQAFEHRKLTRGDSDWKCARKLLTNHSDRLYTQPGARVQAIERLASDTAALGSRRGLPRVARIALPRHSIARRVGALKRCAIAHARAARISVAL